MSDKNYKVHNEKSSKETKTNQKNELEKKTNINIEEKTNKSKQINDNIDIIQIKKEFVKLQKKERENLLRAKAEIENIRKRTEQDISRAYKFALEKFLNELLPVIDNLERAISLIDKEKQEFKSMLEGLELTLKSFLTIISKYGIKIIQNKNVEFNPDLHQAVKTVKSDNKEEKNKVIDIIQKGYILNGRLLRPAMVIVSQ